MEAVTNVGYALFESGILTLAEAEWLENALVVQLEEGPPPVGNTQRRATPDQ